MVSVTLFSCSTTAPIYPVNRTKLDKSMLYHKQACPQFTQNLSLSLSLCVLFEFVDCPNSFCIKIYARTSNQRRYSIRAYNIQQNRITSKSLLNIHSAGCYFLFDSILFTSKKYCNFYVFSFVEIYRVLFGLRCHWLPLFMFW